MVMVRMDCRMIIVHCFVGVCSMAVSLKSECRRNILTTWPWCQWNVPDVVIGTKGNCICLSAITVRVWVHLRVSKLKKVTIQLKQNYHRGHLI